MLCIPDHYQVRGVLLQHPDFQVLHVVTETGTEQQLTVFESDISRAAEFRAAFRTDVARLSEIKHDNVAPLRAWGELEGQFYAATDLPSLVTMAAKDASAGPRSFEELLDVAWQVASALQHLHNCGVTHGHLLPEVLSVNDGLKVVVHHSGLYRWVGIGHHPEVAQRPWSAWAAGDLAQFGMLLDDLRQRLSADDSAPPPEEVVMEFDELLSELRQPRIDLLARDVQGRIGNLLLKLSGETIEMLDQRSGSSVADRSIVDELFDEPPADKPAPKQGHEESTASLSPIVVLLLLAVAGITAVAYLLR
ncbi:MAG: hypothetical protein Fues2KO_06560 [Fuerstiella sp.]